MGRFFGKRWKIDGVTAGPISRHYPANGRYSVIFERDDAFLEQIEKINWAKPTIQRLSEDANEPGLPEGYGFKVVDIKYDNSGRHYTVELQTASQYLGDVTQYQEQIAELESAAAASFQFLTNMIPTTDKIVIKSGISVVTLFDSTSFKELTSPMILARIFPVGLLSKN